MRTLVLLLLLWPAMAWAADAPLQVVLDHPCTVLYSIHGQNDFRPMSEGPVTQATLNLDRGQHYDIRAEGSDDFLHQWEAESQDVAPGAPPLHMMVTRVWLAGRAATIAVALLAVAVVVGVSRRRPVPSSSPSPAPAAKTPTAAPRADGPILSEAATRLSLFPPDGSLPSAIGPYRVLGHLGHGGMAVVYKVEGSAGERLAVKLPFPEVWDDPEFRKRFGRELRIASALEHPNIVRIVEVNDGGGSFPYPYLVMEWVQGRPLQECLCRDLPQPVENIVAVGLQTLLALEHAHGRQVIHRDIKPSNLMVTYAGDIKVMDFGVARKTDGTRLTATDEVLGTPLYMAPEQIQGEPVDARSDIYAVGTILYEMAAGQPPFDDPNYLRLTMKKVRETAPPLRDKNPQVDPRLERVIMRMLSKRPEERPWTADEAALDLKPLAGPGPHRFIPMGQESDGDEKTSPA
ncbi:MAG TPA: serine/threonine-protein kinase [Candidatus Xenobia bacterium]|jgi:hypothetical protein